MSRGSVHVPGVSPRRMWGLPGYLAVRVMRAVVRDRAGRAAASPSERRRRYCLRTGGKASAPGMWIFRGCAHTARVLARLRINRRVAASAARLATGLRGLRSGRGGFAPPGGRSPSFTWSSHTHAPLSQALPGRNSAESPEAGRLHGSFEGEGRLPLSKGRPRVERPGDRPPGRPSGPTGPRQDRHGPPRGNRRCRARQGPTFVPERPGAARRRRRAGRALPRSGAGGRAEG